MKSLERQLKKEITNVFNNGVNKEAVFDMCMEFITNNKSELITPIAQQRKLLIAMSELIYRASGEQIAISDDNIDEQLSKLA